MTLFPKEIIEYSAENHFVKYRITSGYIYISAILLISGGVFLLPLIRVDVGIDGRGVIRPAIERAEIRSVMAGTVRELLAGEGSVVQTGDTIAILDHSDLVRKIRKTENQLSDVRNYLADLEMLLPPDTSGQHLPLRSEKYRQAFALFRRELELAGQEVRRMQKIHARTSALYGRGVISPEQYESVRYQLSKALREKQILYERKVNGWTTQKTELESTMEELQLEMVQQHFEQKKYVVRAPVTGSVTQMEGIHTGSLLLSGQSFGEISPDTTLEAEIYLSPSDIGYIQTGMPVQLRIDAFDSREWGTVQGSITRVSDDVIFREGTPFFVIHCRLEETVLVLENGYRGKVKKGMTLQARFLITRRSLFQLLFDSVSDWLNPFWRTRDV